MGTMIMTIEGIKLRVEYKDGEKISGTELTEEDQLKVIRAYNGSFVHIEDPTEDAIALHNFLWEL